MSVYKNMAFGLKLRGMPKAQINQRVMQAAKILEIEHLLERKPKALSGGQRQRVAVGRAIVREPAAFLFDEPLSNLDAKLRVTTRAELKRLHQRLRTTTIYVTHDQEEAMTLGDRIVVMRDGKIQQADTPLNTYNRPANRFVAGFIGMPPMNFFDGIVKSDNGRAWFVEGKRVNGQLTTPAGGFSILLPSELQQKMAANQGKPVVLGVRPEHLHLRSVDGDGESAKIQVTVNVIEPLGNNMDVYMGTTLHDYVVGRLEAQTGLTAGTTASVYVDMRKAQFFEPGETGMNLTLENLSPKSELAHALT
jgi:multiple sugar transport system ATP-binding protein